MYEIRFRSKYKKRFKELLTKLSPDVKRRLKSVLENNPYPSPTHGDTLCKVEQKGNLYCVEVTGGDRVLFDIIEDKKAILIYYAGNHDGEIRLLKKKIKLLY